LKNLIANYKKPASGKSQKVLVLAEKIELLLPRGYYAQAVSEIEKNRDPEVLEHPDFKILAARLYANARVGRLDDARKLFEDVFAMKIVNLKFYREWVLMERRTSSSLHRVYTVCSRVIAADWIKEDEKLYFYFSRAIAQYNSGREMLSLGSIDAFSCFVDAMNDHLLVLDKKETGGKEPFDRSEEYAANTMHNLLLTTRRVGVEKDVISYVEQLCAQKVGAALDPIAGPLIDYIRSISERAPKNELDRNYGYLRRLDAAIQKGRSLFKNPLVGESIRAASFDKIQSIGKSLKIAR